MVKNEGKKAKLLFRKMVNFSLNSCIVCPLTAVWGMPMFSGCILYSFVY